MPASRPLALQLCPFGEYLEEGLQARFEVVRWFQMSEPAQAAWLQSQGAAVRAVVTGGHIGCGTALMQALPGLGIVAVNGVGLDKVDLPQARARGVRVATTPGALTEDVADLAVGLVISLLRDIPAADAFVRRGQWPQGEKPLARKVSGRRFGVVGLGQIGSAIAARLAPSGRSRTPARRARTTVTRSIPMRCRWPAPATCWCSPVPPMPPPGISSGAPSSTHWGPPATWSTWRAGRWSMRQR